MSDKQDALRRAHDHLEQARTNKVLAKRDIKTWEAEIARLEAMPELLPQPPLHVDIIRFNKRFVGGGRVYRYAAIRVTPGVWYLTGSTSPQQLTWDALARFIEEDNTLVPRYWNAEVVGAPINK